MENSNTNQNPVPGKSKKREMILQTAEVLFRKHGFRKISIEEICEQAGVSKMTFYKYFPNKIKLLETLIDMGFEGTLRLLEELNEMQIPFKEKIKILLQWKEETGKKYNNELLKEIVMAFPEMEEYIASMYKKGIAKIIEFIQEAQQKGEVRKNIRAEFLLAVINNFVELAQNKDLIALYPNYMDLALEINNFIFYGIMPADQDT
jgi:AcrR family transcriptional regulator